MLAPTSADLEILPHIAMTSFAPWNLNLPSFVVMEETYKVSSLNSQQGDANSIVNANFPCMITTVNTFNNAFHDTLTLKMSHDQDDLHNLQVCIDFDLPTLPPDKRLMLTPIHTAWKHCIQLLHLLPSHLNPLSCQRCCCPNQILDWSRQNKL